MFERFGYNESEYVGTAEREKGTYYVALILSLASANEFRSSVWSVWEFPTALLVRVPAKALI